MQFNNSTLIIIIVVGFALFLIWNQNNQPKYNLPPMPPQAQTHTQAPPPTQISPFKPQINGADASHCPNCEVYKQRLSDSHRPQTPNVTNVVVEQEGDQYSDPIKKQDMYTMMDPLTYPQGRLPREVLEKYNDYHQKNGSFPPFGQATQPLFDNPILNGILIKEVDENEPFADNVPSSIPLFRVKSAKNANRFFYYILEQRYLSKVELKIPLDHIKVNGVRYNNADFYGVPELYDGDTIENIAIYPNTKFKVNLYKLYHFP